MEFKVNIRSVADTIDILTGTGDSWGAYLEANESGLASSVGAFTDSSFFNFYVNNGDAGLGAEANQTFFEISHGLMIQTNADGASVDTLGLNDDGTIQLPAYGAGVLTSDGSGNITSVAGGGGGVSEEMAIVYAVSL